MTSAAPPARRRAVEDIDSVLADLQAGQRDPAAYLDRVDHVLGHVNTYPDLDPRGYEGRQLVNPVAAQLRRLHANGDVSRMEGFTSFATPRLAQARVLLSTRQHAMDRLNQQRTGFAGRAQARARASARGREQQLTGTP